MNILFLLKTLEMGGLEVVTATLANCFAAKGHNVSIFAFDKTPKVTVSDRLNPSIQVHVEHSLQCNDDNIGALRNLMKQQQTQVVINQWGLPYFLLRTARKAAEGQDVKFISVYHNSPDKNGRLQSIDNILEVTNNPLKRWALKSIRSVFKAITSHSMRWCYTHSDRYMVLSPSFVPIFKAFTGLKNAPKLIVQTNPVTIDCAGFTFSAETKQKEIIFVGRLDFFQKKVNRVIETWALLEKRYPDWQLTIVGDGPDRKNVEQRVKELQLQRVQFEGFQKPIEYYKRASMLMLTSEFEGFPLVLAEAMSFGVVPVVYNSYAAAADIVHDGVNGLLIPYCSEGFDASTMAQRMAAVMKDANRLNNMALEAIKTSQEYSIDTIYDQWMNVFKELC